jgi:hypothetical protein
MRRHQQRRASKEASREGTRVVQKQQQSSVYLFALGGGLLMLVSLVGWTRSVLFPTRATPCSGRYLATMNFPEHNLRQHGDVIRDIQTKVGLAERGLIENVRFEKTEDAPSDYTFDVSLRHEAAKSDGKPRTGGKVDSEATTSRSNGTSFQWSTGLKGGTLMGCLAYSVMISPDFDYANGGVLPGIFGGDVNRDNKRPGARGFAANLVWRANGAGDVIVTGPTMDRDSIAGGSWYLPRGRWVRIEQEVVLNNPEAADGLIRVWVDGDLRVEQGGMVFRTLDSVRVSGVQADAHYGMAPEELPPEGENVIKLTPFELRWE